MFPLTKRSVLVIKLTNIKMKQSVDQHIEDFQELAEICGTPDREAYTLFLLSLPKEFKQDFSKEFRLGSPAGMKDAYEFARTCEISNQWNWNPQEKRSDKAYRTSSTITGRVSTSERKAANKKDPNNRNWGTAQKVEGKLYRQHDRCCKCGKGPWSDPQHPCLMKST